MINPPPHKSLYRHNKMAIRYKTAFFLPQNIQPPFTFASRLRPEPRQARTYKFQEVWCPVKTNPHVKQNRSSSTFDIQRNTHSDVIVSVNLLVGGMSSVITPSDRQQEDIEVENVGKVEGDRDGTAFTGVIRHLAVNRLGSLVRRTIRVVLFFLFFFGFLGQSLYPLALFSNAHVGVSLKAKPLSAFFLHSSTIPGNHSQSKAHRHE